jgi:hypothetical protein
MTYTTVLSSSFTLFRDQAQIMAAVAAKNNKPYKRPASATGGPSSSSTSGGRRYSEKELPGRLDLYVPESRLYTQLLNFEQRLGESLFTLPSLHSYQSRSYHHTIPSPTLRSDTVVNMGVLQMRR